MLLKKYKTKRKNIKIKRKKMDKQFLKETLQELDLNIQITDEMLDKFEIYYEFLIEKNQVMNLTTITDEKEVIIKHFYDSVSTIKAFPIKDSDKVIDIGVGAGFPSIPIKIMLPNVHFTLVDSLNKRIKFLDELIEKLELKNVTTIHARVEDLARDKKRREKFDVCVNRAVANFATLVEYTSPFVKRDGNIVCLKGKNYKEEIEGAEKAFMELEVELSDVVNIEMPTLDTTHYVVVLKKVGQVSAKYPRKAGTINKNPL